MTLEASTIHSTTALCPTRVTIGPRLLRLRSDDQLVALFRAGHDEAFQVIYDRYHKRLEAYARRMLGGNHDAEDVLQEVFVRAHRSLLTGDRELAVKAWLFRIVHNRCIDEIRRAAPPQVEMVDTAESRSHDPAYEVDTRESLRRLLEDIRRLPEQQRSALLLRELSGISYAEVASVLETSVPAVKSLLVRARMGLVRASEARDTACSEIRAQLVEAHEQGVRANSTVRSHLRDCQGCRSYRREVFLVRKQLAALSPAGPFALLAKLIGLPGGGATGGGSAAPAAAVGGGGAASGMAIGAGHVATLMAAAIASAGGAVGLQHVIGLGSQSPARAASAHRAPARHHLISAGPTAGSSRSYVPGWASSGSGGGQAAGTGGAGRWVPGQPGSGVSAGGRADALLAASDTAGQGQSAGGGGGITNTQTGSTGGGSGTSSGSPGSVPTGSSGGPTVAPGSTEGAGVGVTPVAPGAGGTSGTGSTTSTGTTTTVGGTTVGSTGVGTGSSGSTTTGSVPSTGQGPTTTGPTTTGPSPTSSGNTTIPGSPS